MTALGDILKARIAATGPITLADYMAECLLHPQHGYYTTRTPFGTAGDFITAPEISQMFGELIGLCLAQSWLDQGAPPEFNLVELGPGRGTMMRDILRATKSVPGFHAQACVTLVEASEKLAAVQAQTLAGGAGVTWAKSVHALTEEPLFLVANEFFDALPIRQFQRAAQGWRERLVGLADDRLTLGLGPETQVPALASRLSDTTPGQIVEICPAAPAIMAEIARLITEFGGMALIIDYGGWHSRGDTFQALRSNRFADPLTAPGQADLTAHVDFEALARAAAPLSHAYTTQGALLRRLGVEARSQRLAQGLSGEALNSHLAATRRLTDDGEMGSLFKALVLYPAACPLPAGFV